MQFTSANAILSDCLTILYHIFMSVSRQVTLLPGLVKLTKRKAGNTKGKRDPEFSLFFSVLI